MVTALSHWQMTAAKAVCLTSDSSPIRFVALQDNARRERLGFDLADGLKEMGTDVVVPAGPCPATVGEAAFGVFLGATRGLHNTIKRNKFGNNNFSHVHKTMARYLQRAAYTPP